MIQPYTEDHRSAIKELIRQFRIETALLKARDVQPSDQDLENELNDYLKNGYSILLAFQEGSVPVFWCYVHWMECGGWIPCLQSKNGVAKA
jgi:hypothetical protein